ncbi:unnamed protein product [Arctogadus glacialis]
MNRDNPKQEQDDFLYIGPRICATPLLSHTKDHLQFLQAFRSLKNPPPTRDWTTVEVRPPSYVGTWRRSLDQLEETLNMEMKKQRDAAELKRVQYEVDVTLDPDTAHCCLILSEDGKQAHHGGVVKKLPDNPPRFTVYPRVLTRQSFSSGIFYFEVQVKDNKPLWRLGVARESINRKFHIKLTSGMGYWVIIFNKVITMTTPGTRCPRWCLASPWAGSSARATPAFVFSALIELNAVDQRPSGAGPGATGKHQAGPHGGLHEAKPGEGNNTHFGANSLRDRNHNKDGLC